MAKKKKHTSCNTRSLIRRWPGICAAAHSAMHRWIEDEEIVETRGFVAFPRFTQACRCEPASVVVPRLLQYGCPPELVRFLLQVQDISTTALRTLRARPLSLVGRLVSLSPPRSFELAANLDYTCEASLLALSGTWLSFSPDGSSGDAPAEKDATSDQLSQLRLAVEAVQTLAGRVANHHRGKVALSEEHARILRRLDRVGTDMPYRRAGYRFELEELIQTRRLALGTVVWEFDPDAEPQAYQGSWGRGADEPYDDRFGENWIVASAASYLVGVCRGAFSEWIGKCYNCGVIWAEKPRKGSPGTYCPRCRHNEDWGTNKEPKTRPLRWLGNRAYVHWVGENIFVKSPRSPAHLKTLAQVDVLPGRIRTAERAAVSLEIVDRTPAQDFFPSNQA